MLSQKTIPASELTVGDMGNHFEVAAIEPQASGLLRITLTSRTGSGCAGARYYKPTALFQIHG